jgi:hypothetical protein
MEDSSLDSFLDADESESAAGSDTTDESESAESTYAWDPEGAACEGCGAVVERRWRDDGDLVCDACKSW